GFKECNAYDLKLISPFQKWTCNIRLVEAETLPVRLDAAGPSCLAFYSNRVGCDSLKLKGLGAKQVTKPFKLTVGSRVVEVALMRAPGGALIELINPNGGKNG
ncbi:MAG: hypothetical protein CUN55_19445, partial [Phototrophicales bacterium]